MSLAKARRIAREKGIAGKISNSTRKGKRLMIERPDGKIIHFGSATGQTFIDHGDKDKRKAWRARHREIMRGGKPAYKDRDSPSFYAWKILW